jgi:hypothetical protein
MTTAHSRRSQAAARCCFILTGAVAGVAWASSLRGFMRELAGPASVFTFSGTFGIIIAAGLLVGGLLGLAEYERRAGPQHAVLIWTPLLLAVIPGLGTASLDVSPTGLAVLGMMGGYSVSGRGPAGARIAAGIVALAIVPVTYLAPKPVAGLSVTTAHGAWFATLGSSLFMVFALACSIPMRRPAGPVTGPGAPVGCGDEVRRVHRGAAAS